MNPLARIGTGRLLWLMAAAGAAALWLWICWCFFPVSMWNDVRLAPALALARGVSFYPAEHAGAVTTWIYGPLPILLWWPAAFSASAARALEVAGAINLLTTVVAIAAVCAWWPAPAGGALSWRERALAATVAIAIWPYAAFQFLQADNLAIAVGLLGNLLLVRSPSPRGRWGAAALAVAALACKQTSLGPSAAQIVWLGLVAGWGEARRHFGRCVACGFGFAGWMAASFDWAGLRTNLFTVPAHLPWAPDLPDRIVDRLPQLAIQLLAPALVMAVARKRIWHRDSVLFLPSLTWLLALPASLAAFLKFGGTLNSLQGFSYWLPPALVAGIAGTQSGARARSAFAAIALAGIAICGWRVARLNQIPLLPLTEHYREAAQLDRIYAGRIWFPWNPLVTIYGEGRFDHVEDGLCMRLLAGHPASPRQTRLHLPPEMCAIALPWEGTDWGLALKFAPPDARIENRGWWKVHSWPPQPRD